MCAHAAGTLEFPLALRDNGTFRSAVNADAPREVITRMEIGKDSHQQTRHEQQFPSQRPQPLSHILGSKLAIVTR